MKGMNQRTVLGVFWKVLSGFIFLVIALFVIAPGLRSLAPNLAFPLLGDPEEDDVFIDVASVLALTVVFGTTFFLTWILRLRLYPKRKHAKEDDEDEAAFKTIVFGAGFVFAAVDACAFYLSIVDQRHDPFGGGKGVSFSGVILTLLYVGLVVLIALIIVRLEPRKPKSGQESEKP